MRWLFTILLGVAMAVDGSVVSTAVADDWETPQTRLRPIGSPSAVDAFHLRAPSADRPQDHRPSIGTTSAVRQAAMMQSAPDSFSMPPPSLPQGGAAPGPSPSLPAPLSSSPALGPIAPPPADVDTTPLPRPGISAAPAPLPQSVPAIAPGAGQTISPPGMAPVPRWSAPSGPAASGGDYAPLAQPQLESDFATLGNCRNISPPSGYRSDRILTCGPPPTGYVTTVGASAPPPTYLPPTYLPPPAQLGPPMILPPTAAPSDAFPLASSQTVIPGPAGHRPLISFGQERYPVQIGQGILGQPVAYVPGQTFRNAIRYLTW